MAKVLFFGTPAFAVPSMAGLLDAGHDVVAVVTQPDQARGRGQKVSWSPVKQFAIDQGRPVLQPTSLKDDEFLDILRALTPDLAVVAAYGRLLPQVLLDLPRRGFVNVHASLLPRWRGAAPVHRAMLAGDATTGVTIMRVVLALDAGPMIARTTVSIGPDETSDALEARLAAAGAELLIETIPACVAGGEQAVAQDEAAVTYARRLTRDDSPIDWSRSAADVHNHIRGLHPWPLATTTIAGRRAIVRRSQIEIAADGHPPPAAAPGTIVEAHGDRLIVAAGAGRVRILEIQLEGRRPIGAREFINGVHLGPGAACRS